MGENVGIVFCNARITGEINGVKFNDVNGNTVWEENESAIGGWTIELYENNDGEIGSFISQTQTATEGEGFGEYLFDGLEEGDYFVCEVAEDGWTQTFPQGCWEVSITSEQRELFDVNFGNRRNETLYIEKSNGSSFAAPGDSVTYTIRVTNLSKSVVTNLEIVDVLPGGFSYVVGSTLINGVFATDPTNESGKLTWTIEVLLPGESIEVDYQALISTDASAAIYTNIATSNGTIEANQTDSARLPIIAQDEDVESGIATSNVSIGRSSGLSAGIGGGQVLGAQTGQVLGATLPATGSETGLTILFLAMIAVGFSLKGVARKVSKND